MYNAGPAKLGAILGKGPNVGKRNKNRFMKKYKCYSDLVKDLEKALEANGGYIYGIDGRRFYVRNKKDVLNTVLQGNSAIIFKTWMVGLEKKRLEFQEKYGVKLRQILAYHDELGFELYEDNPTLAKLWGDICIEEARKVGEEFELNIPIGAEAKVGYNWAETH